MCSIIPYKDNFWHTLRNLKLAIFQNYIRKHINYQVDYHYHYIHGFEAEKKFAYNAQIRPSLKFQIIRLL